ncbi:hypothetical protein CR194_09530 [Salipaludibacillus keqinensis]|uniref:RDD domain-containing protein n=1 Tax=Salipaludibacillus keqinensis TaxID=2045207 RepID=A0A323TEM5_9BACI|nr:RDD family protein [Salipaludibacillus keqinensis]PYZ93409.1 hypothetical protein CR194_09530 [Salipaludibacillus keqinensis]
MHATFLVRLKAFMYDYVLIFAYLIILFMATVFIFPSLQNFFTGSLMVAQLTGFLLVTSPVSLYFIISDSRIGGQSVGKKLAGIRVVSLKGSAISLPQATLRTTLKFLPWELSHFLVYRLIYIGDGDMPFNYYLIGGLIYALMFVYILTAIFLKNKQSLYDLITRTQVINVHSK